MLKPLEGAGAFLLVVILALHPGWAHAQDQDKAYDLQVVVHFARNRLLTDEFRKQVERELADDLRVSLGDRVQVRVGTEHPRLAEVLRDGLAVLDDWPGGAPGVKTHFVLIDYRDGRYEIRARQHDGTTGLGLPGPAGLYGKPRPVVRVERTEDRAFVPALAAGLIEKDFGLLGTIDEVKDKEGLVRVRVQGGGDGPLDRLVGRGEVFAIAPPGSGPGRVLPWALLRVEQPPVGGVCECRYFSRHGDLLRKGTRCVLLGTVTAPLQVRLTVRDATGNDDSTSLTLEVRRKGFEEKEALTLRSDSRNDRLLHVSAPFTRLAFVTVADRANDKPVIPVVLVDDEPVEIQLSAEPERDPLRYSRENWEQGVLATYLKINPLFDQLNRLTQEGKDRKAALQRAQGGLRELRDDEARLAAQRKDLWEQAEAAKVSVKLRAKLEAGDELLRQVRGAQKRLEELIARLDALEKEEPQRQAWIEQLNHAGILEDQLEIDKALAIYHKLLREGFKEKNLEDRVRKLETVWKPASEEHRKARVFLYERWPKLTTVKQLLAQVEEADKALQVCIAAKDRFGPQRFLSATLAHGERLKKEYEKLNPRINVGDEEQVKDYKEATEKLESLARKANEYLSTLAQEP